METLTGIMIAGLIFYSGKLIAENTLDINNFFSFLAAMMLAYQPVRSLATLNMAISQGLSGAKRLLPIIDMKNKINHNESGGKLNLSKGEIEFKNISVIYIDPPYKTNYFNKILDILKKNKNLNSDTLIFLESDKNFNFFHKDFKILTTKNYGLSFLHILKPIYHCL